MQEMSDAALSAVRRSHTMLCRVESWLDGELLADDVPVEGGGEDRDRSLAVPEQISLAVPQKDGGTDWTPVDEEHPLAAYGQRLHISYGIDLGRHGIEWIPRGWFQVTGSGQEGDRISVQAEGLLTLVDEAKFISPFQPSGTLVSTLQALVEPALTVEVDAALADRSVPTSMQWDTDRLAALGELLDAWPAAARVDEDGILRIEPFTDTGEPVLDLTDGVGGTVIRWQGDTSRDGAFNVVVAQGETVGGVQIQGVAYDENPSSPLRFGGPFSALPVPFVYSSPLLSTVAQCRAAAAVRLAQMRRTAALKLSATIVPHPGLMTGDVVSVTGAGLTAQPCMIEGLSLPYTPGEMSLTLRVVI